MLPAACFPVRVRSVCYPEQRSVVSVVSMQKTRVGCASRIYYEMRSEVLHQGEVRTVIALTNFGNKYCNPN